MDTRRTGNQVSLRAFFSFLVILVLLAGAPAAGTAEAPEVHTHEGWTAVEALPTASGSYYLTKDIEISKTWTIGSGADISLCLNDHSITMTASGIGIVINGGTLNLYDCGTTVHSYTTDKQPATIGSGTGSFTGGYITHAAGKTGPAIHIKTNNSKFNMYGGTLIGNNNPHDQYNSGAVDLISGTFNLYNGTIAGNLGSDWLGGGGVYISSGRMNMYGGEIRHNDGGFGGSGIMIYCGALNMSNGSIHHNTGNAGGGVFLAEGTVSMTGGSISENTANTVAGVVVNGTMYMSGGSITGNTDSGIYGCVCIGGTMYLSGGSITGNISNSGGIMCEAGTIDIAGNPVVAGNRNTDGDEVNVYLPNEKTINISGAMTSGASVGITTRTTPTAGNPFKFGLKYRASNTMSPDNWFFSDKGLDVIGMNDTSDQDAYLAAKVTLTYDGNGADSGNAPAAKTVTHGTVVTVEGAGTLKKAGNIFDHWTTGQEGRRDSIAPGDRITLEENKTLYASWLAGHTVTWMNGDGSVLDEKGYLEGEPKPTTEKTPTKEPDDDHTYVYKEWKEMTDSDGDTVYTPVFTAVPIPTHEVTWLDGDGSILDKKEYKEGKDKPTTDKTPVKAEDDQNTYAFEKWEGMTDTDGNTVYKPVFRTVPKSAAAAPGQGAVPAESPTAALAAAPTASPTAAPAITPAPTAAPEPTATPKPVPKTGDREDMILWTVLMTLCAGVLAVLLVLKPDRKKK